MAEQALPPKHVTLLRRYLQWAIPALLVLAALLFVFAMWQARRTIIEQVAQEMQYAAALVRGGLTEPAALLDALPDAPFARDLFAVDGESRVIARAGDGPAADQFLLGDFGRQIIIPFAALGAAYERGRTWFDSEMIYFWQPGGASYALVSRVLPQAVLQRALLWATPPVVALIGLFSLAGGLIDVIETRRNRQYVQLIEASREVTLGDLDRSMAIGGNTDLSRLGAIVDNMRQALKQRIDEDQLLLSVSRETARTIDINAGMPQILDALIKATDADGVRAIVFNPLGGRPLQYGSGELAQQMSPLDRQLLVLLRNAVEEVILPNAAAIQTQLGVTGDGPLPAEALVAFPLVTSDRLHGLLWAGYRAPLAHEPAQLSLMRSFATQATTLAAGARLFAAAEGGRRRLAAVLASTADAVAVIDQTNRFALVNPAFERAFGIDVAGAVGSPVTEMVRRPDLLGVLLGDVQLAAGREIVGKDSRTFYASVSKVFGQDSAVLGRVVVLHDITRFKQLETIKSEFVSNVSHDLRNPLAYMHTYASMLGQVGPLNGQQQEYVDGILHGITRMHTTIGAVLDLNRIETAVDTLDFEPIDVGQFLEQIAAEQAAQAERQGNTLVVQPIETPLNVFADRWSLQIALNNLISNALKYARGHGDVTLAARPANNDRQEVVISVHDNGPGISKEDQMRLFEKYYRAAQPEALNIEGSGLGLAIVKSIAERHSGRAWVESEIGQGSTFYLALPMRPPVSANGSGPHNAVTPASGSAPDGGDDDEDTVLRPALGG